MIGRIQNCRILWTLLSLLSLVVAIIGVVFPEIYGLVVTSELLPGVIAQDLVTIFTSVTTLLLIVRIDQSHSARQMIILGINGYLFYGYGIYVIEQMYTILYLAYMAIFSLSFYSIAYCLANIDRDFLSKIRVTRTVRLSTAVYLFVIAVMFNIIWIGRLIPLIQTGTKLEYFYSIYVLDLCFIMPLFFIMGVLTVKNNGLGLSVSPTLMVLGFLVLIPLAIGEVLKPILYGLEMGMEGLVLFLPLSLIFLVLAVFYLRRMEIS